MAAIEGGNGLDWFEGGIKGRSGGVKREEGGRGSGGAVKGGGGGDDGAEKGRKGEIERGEKETKKNSLIFGKPLVGKPAAALQVTTLAKTNRFGCGSLMPCPTCATSGRIINAATV